LAVKVNGNRGAQQEICFNKFQKKLGSYCLQEIRITPIVELWTHCQWRNKPDASQRSAPRWTLFSL